MEESRPSDFWAFVEVDALVKHHPEQGFQLILDLLQSCQNEFAISYIATGPLENLLNHNSVEIWELVRDEAERNERLKKALFTVLLDAKNPIGKELDQFLSS